MSGRNQHRGGTVYLSLSNSVAESQSHRATFGHRRRRDLLRALVIILMMLDILITTVFGLLYYEKISAQYNVLFTLSFVFQVTLFIFISNLLLACLSRQLISRLNFFNCVGMPVTVAALPFLVSIILITLFAPADPFGDRAVLLQWQAAWGLSAMSGVALARLPLWLVARRWAARGLLKERVAIVGGGELAERLFTWLHDYCSDTVEIVGIFDDRTPRSGGRTMLGDAIVGKTDDLIRMSRSTTIDRIILALPHAAEERLKELTYKLKQIPAHIGLAPDRAGFAACATGEGLAGLPIVDLDLGPMAFNQRLIKAAFDRLLAAVALLLFSPIMLIAAVAIKLDSCGDIFFVQERFGLGNRIIRVRKFRTMHQTLGDKLGSHQTERNDPRITRVGHLLRKSSIDELPQLFNVIIGDMSLVGPRPLPIHMRVQDQLNHEIISDYAYRHRVKPGLTGLAQVKGHRGAVATTEELSLRFMYDIFYIENWSFALDIIIILMTPIMFLGHENAF